MTFCQIATFAVSSGFGEGLMYRVNNSQRMLSSVFYFNIGVAIFLYSILFLVSNLIADFYNMPRLGILIKLACVNIIVFSFSYIQKILKQINIDFKSMAMISLISSILGSFIGIFMAYLGYGVWSIVLLTLSMNLLEMVLLWITTKWRPSLTFSWSELKMIIPYSSKILFNNLIQTLYDNIYSLIIGKFFNAKSLGYFNRMQTVAYYTTTNFMYSIESVFFPILCKRKDDYCELIKSYEKLLRITTFLAFPVLFFLIGLAKPIVVLILTEKWIDGVIVLKLIATAYLFVPIIYINNSFLKLFNKTDILFYSNFIKKAIGLSILVITVFQGFYYVCYGVIAYYFFDALISMYCSHRFLDISFAKQLKFISNNILINLVIFVFLLTLCNSLDNNFLILLLGVLIMFAGNYLMSKFCGLKEYNILTGIINQLLGKS